MHVCVHVIHVRLCKFLFTFRPLLSISENHNQTEFFIGLKDGFQYLWKYLTTIFLEDTSKVFWHAKKLYYCTEK